MAVLTTMHCSESSLLFLHTSSHEMRSIEVSCCVAMAMARLVSASHSKSNGLGMGKGRGNGVLYCLLGYWSLCIQSNDVC